jgi:YegS/Rv2252/BmrU family lipid kinase
MDVRALNRKYNISYFLLGKKIYFFINPFSRNINPTIVFKKLLKNLHLYSFNIVLSNSKLVAETLTQEVASKDSLIIVMGGDGTINSAINQLKYKDVTLGVIPTGTANDFATEMKIPRKLTKALAILEKGYTRKVDLIRINNSYFLTVGGLGIVSEIAKRVNYFKRKGGFLKFIHRHILKALTYKLFTYITIMHGKKYMKNEVDIEVDGKNFFKGKAVAVFVGKQQCLGKSFLVCPGVSEENKYVCISVLKYKSFFRSIIDAGKLSKGKPYDLENFIYTSGNEFRITTEKFSDFLGDGEILDRETEFIGKRIDENLRIVVPEK